ncbi:MAG: glycosyltransferase [Blastochloris viridis]|uniref:Glycosyltransferase n=1 Tax=Blastochloris viridis TaxID=1079 RepID=A0A6N4R883_BLAVI|nr:MAG: glycosyltransferase [Blastochloris viridis]
MTISKPTDLAVLLCSYNANKTLPEAVASILASEYPLDLYVIDDGSLEPVETILSPTENLYVIRAGDSPKGLIGALNFGLEYIIRQKKYKFIGRMDADDISYPDRFTKQVTFLKSNQDVGMVGAWAVAIDEKSKEALYPINYPCDWYGISKALKYNNCFIHPLLCFRSEMFERYGLYSEEYQAAEDYEIIRRFAKYAKLANLSEYLIDYRISSGGISLSKRRQQLNTRLKVQKEFFEPLSIHSWLGILKTLILYSVPMSALQRLKKCLNKYDKK